MGQRHKIDLNISSQSLVKSLRGLAGYSQGELAQEAGIARSTLANAEDPVSGTERRTLIALHFALGASSPKEDVEAAIDAAVGRRNVRITGLEFEVLEDETR